jgi:hypothetical protein
MSKKINIDFDILDTKNPKYFSIVDQSEWGLIENNTSYIEITLPGYSKPVTKYFDKKAVNTYNAYTLEILCIEDCSGGCYEAIPDGIYHITVRSTCNKYFTTKKYLKTTILELELDKIIIANIKCDKAPSKGIENKITEIEFLIKAAKAHLRYDNINEAGQLYTKACSEIEKIKDCK